MEKRMNKALALLRAKYPDALITAERIEGGMKRPCLQIMRTAASLKHEMGSRWRLGESYELNYYPSDGEDADEKAEALLLLAKEVWPWSGTSAARDGGMLRVSVEAEELCFLTPEEAETMKRELLTLQLKWQDEAQKG